MHSHHGHGHSSRAPQRRRLAISLVLAAVYMVAEVIGGWFTGSLALLADAGHMASDVASLALTLIALWIADRPATQQRTYGHARAEILAALAQGAALIAVALVIAIEAVERLGAPPAVQGAGVVLIATGGLIVNGIALLLLSGGSDHLSVRGAWLHVASDALGSIGAIAAGAAIWAFGWSWADPVASLVIACLVVAGAVALLRDAIDILMEAAPRHLDVEEIRSALCSLPDIDALHDLHVWTIGSGEVALSSHIVCGGNSQPGEVLQAARSLLADRFSLHHATLQVEPRDFSESDEPCDGGCEIN